MIALDPKLVKGSHGRTDQSPDHQPMMVLPPGSRCDTELLPCQSVRDVILSALFDEELAIGGDPG
jgi:hypothetical protein